MPTKKTKKKAAPRSGKKQAQRKAVMPYGLTVGQTLTRTFKGKEIAVKVVEEGFVYQDQTFTSLSACARRITGYGISGPVFFKLVSTEKPKKEST